MKDAYYYSRTEAVLIIKAYGKGSFIQYVRKIFRKTNIADLTLE